MTTLSNRPHTAVLVIDPQQGVLNPCYDRDHVVDNIVSLVTTARDASTDVVWVQNHNDYIPRGSEAWELLPELEQLGPEVIVHKGYPDAFEDTDLEHVLASQGIGRLVVAGAQSDACLRATLHGAFVRGYDVTLVRDAHTTEDRSAYGIPAPEQVIALTNLYWDFTSAPGRTAGAVPLGEIDWR